MVVQQILRLGGLELGVVLALLVTFFSFTLDVVVVMAKV